MSIIDASIPAKAHGAGPYSVAELDRIADPRLWATIEFVRKGSVVAVKDRHERELAEMEYELNGEIEVAEKRGADSFRKDIMAILDKEISVIEKIDEISAAV